MMSFTSSSRQACGCEKSWQAGQHQPGSLTVQRSYGLILKGVASTGRPPSVLVVAISNVKLP
jgi:hypothetical protein